MYRIPLRTRGRATKGRAAKGRAASLGRKASFASVRNLIAQRRRLRWRIGLALAAGLSLGMLLLGAD